MPIRFTAGLKSAEQLPPVPDRGTATRVGVAHTATLLKNGTVLVAGGQDSTAELFDPAAGTFTETGSLGTTREFLTATLLIDGRVVIAGGRTGGAGALASAELYQ
jgi:hypothetical protein